MVNYVPPEVTNEDIASCYLGEDERLLSLIIKTVRQLPSKVAYFVVDRCCFVSVGRVISGMILPGRIVHYHERRSRNMWIIILDENIASRDTQSANAHGIAHAWLGHDRIKGTPDNAEIATANLAKDWGFIGKGADAKFCESRFR